MLGLRENWLQGNMLNKTVKQQGYIKLSTIVMAVLVTTVALLFSYGSAPSTVLAQTDSCTPSLHRLVVDGQQVDISESLIQEFTDQTPIGDSTVSSRIDAVVLQEGFASIPLKPGLATGNRSPRLRSVGSVYEHFYWFRFQTATVWRVRNQSSVPKTVTLRSQLRYFDWWKWRWVLDNNRVSETVTIPAYSDGFIKSPDTSRRAKHFIQFEGRRSRLKSPSSRTYRDSRTIQTGESQPLFEVLKQTGLVNVANDELPAGISLTAAGIFAGDPQQSVWKISNGDNQESEVTLQALDSEIERTFTVPANTNTYVTSDEDGCVDNPSANQEALWVAESEGLLKVLTQSGEVAFELAITEPIETIDVSPIDRTVWVMTQGGRLEGFDSNGQSISDSQIALTSPVSAMEVGTTTAWIVSANKLFLSARDGSGEVSEVLFSEPVLSLTYDSLRDRVWVLLGNKLVAIDANGQQQAQIDLSPNTISLVAYDKRLDNLWLVSTQNATDIVLRYTSNGEEVLSYDTNAIHAWNKASADSAGGLWLANNTEITHVAKTAVPDFTVPAFSDLADTTIVDISAGSSDKSIWAANQTVLRQYSDAGALLKTITPEMGDGVIRNLSRVDLETDLPATIPTLTIVAPTEGAVLTEVTEVELRVNPDDTDLSTIQGLINGNVFGVNCAPSGENVLCQVPQFGIGELTYAFTAQAEDGTVSDQASVTVTVDPVAPIIALTSPQPNQVFESPQILVAGTVNETASVTVNGQDVAVNDQLEFSQMVTLTEGVNTLTIMAVDAAANESSQVLIVSLNSNEPPIIDSEAVLTAKAENNYFYDVEASDSNGDALVYSLTESPSGMTIESDTGVINWTPSTEGSASVIISVSDGKGGTAEQSYTITVFPANLPPEITSTPPNQTTVDANYVYNVAATDPDGDTLSYRLLDAPSGLRINSSTGQVTWVPYNAGTSSVSIEVSDPSGLSARQDYNITTFFTDGKEPPVMAPIGDITAPLGQTTTRIIQANDVDGQPITFRISPLPLPEGMSFHEKTGEFEYRPVEGDVGNRFFRFSASDGRFESAQTVRVIVPEPDGSTRLRGRTLLPDGTPIPGVRFEMGGQESISDANGDFLIENIPGPSGRKRFIVDGSGVDPSLGTFATIPEQFNMVAGVENHLFAPVYLLPLDIASADKVDPFQETVITSSDVIIDGVNYGPVEITIDPRTANLPANGGELFDDIISISRIPDVDFGPAPMPEDLDLSVYIAVQPFGVNYTEPARVSFPNVEGFPAGTIVDIFGLNHDTGAFEKTGEAEVSADGRKVVSIGGAVFNNSWHGFVPRDPDPDPENDDCDCEGDEDANSSFGLKTGNFKDYYQTPSYYSVGQSRNVTLVYNSKWASPNPILNFDTTAGLPPPVSMSQSLSIAGIETPEVFLRPDSFGSILGGAVAKNAVMFDASGFRSGVYPYEFTISCQFPISRRAGSAEGQTVIINESNSPYGAGWSVADLRRLYVSSDRQFVAMDLANGNFWRFTQNPDGTYEAPAAHFSELFENADGTFRLVTKSGTQYNFDLLGLLTSVSDRNNNETSYTYDSNQRLTIITDPVGLQTRFTYLGEKLQRITDPSGRFVEFEHDAEGNLVKIKDPDNTEINYAYQPDTHLRTQKINKRGFVSTVTYDQFGRYQSVELPDNSVRAGRSQDVQSLPDLRENSGGENDLAPPPPNIDEIESGYTDANGNAKRYQYDNDGFLMNTTDAVGRTTEIERDADKNPTITTRPNGSIVRNTYDDNGNVLTSLEEFNGALTTYTYDQFSLVTSIVDALNRRTEMNRDARGNVTRTENAEGHVSTMQYNVRGQVARMIDTNGLVTEYEYDSNFLLIRKTETPPTGNVRITTTQYNTIGLPISVTTPDGITQSFEYDELNRPTRVQNQLGEAQTTNYDEYGNVVESRVLNIDGSTATQESREYDSRDRVITITRPHENGELSITRQEYDGNSNVKKTTDPDGKVTQYFYDGENRTIQMIQPDGGIVFYEYDTRDQLVSVKAGNGAETTYEYDVLMRKLAENSPDRGRWEWEYNIVDRVTRQTDDRGVTIDYTYDLLDRLLTKTFPTASENVAYAYDSCAAGVGRLCARTDESGSHSYSYDFFGNVLDMSRVELGVTYTESYVYDEGDNPIQCTYPTGRVVDFARDGIRRTSAISSNGVSIINQMSYRGDSQMIGRQWQNGLAETRSYDRQARITQIALGSLGNRDYRYDASSNIISISSPFQTGTYGYDQNDRLTNELLNDNNETGFSYDFNGNRLQKLVNAGQSNESYLYEQNSNKLLNTDSVAPNGSSSGVDNRELSHNDADRIRSIIIDNQVVGTYYYNDLGLRSRKERTLTDGTTETTIYHYNMAGGLIAETSAAGETQREYIWNGMEPVAQVQASGTTYLHSDHLYTSRLGTNETQSVVWQWESGAFGNTEPQVDNVVVNLRFPGQYFDVESGLFYNWNRYYDPEIGRYVTSDPIGLAGGLNTYGYVGGNPINYYDLDGLRPIPSGDGKDLTACVRRIRQEALSKFNFADDHLIHCYVSCKLISECGLGGISAALLGYVKEGVDIVGPGDAELRDLFNNAAGRACALSGEPECKGCNNQLPAEPGECTLCCNCKNKKGKLKSR